MSVGVPSGAHLTYEPLRDLPDDGRRYELLDGALPNVSTKSDKGCARRFTI